ncbi:MAG: hypothetical protein P8M67_03705 [Opitutales bacterium]|nr:hypothetical protein [Opitutales bacterium]
MNALAVIFRLLATLSLAALASVIWTKWETHTAQSHSFLDEVVSDAFNILQSERDSQWKDISKKKSAFNEIFESNDQVGQNDENPLAEALDTLRSAEDIILRNPDYRDSLERLNKEFGSDALVWNSELKQWKENPAVKLSAPAGFMNPFADEEKFPKQDVKKEDGTIIKGVPRDNRLRTVIGMLYKDRNDKFGEIAKLRSMIVARDQELREFQNLYAKEKQRKEELEDLNGKLNVEIEGLKADLALEKEERMNEKDAAEQKELVSNQRIATLEEEKISITKRNEESLEALMNEHKETMASLRDDIREAESAGYKRGIDEMVAKQQGGEIVDEEEVASVNPFQIKKEGPPVLSQAELMIASKSKTIGESGVPATIARIDGKSGMMLIPLGSERGVEAGSVFTLWKDKRKAARIRVQSSRQGFSLAYILPRFGSPEKLRPGDNVHVVPETEETL